MKSIFMAKGLTTLSEQLNYVMNCPKNDHEAIYNTVKVRAAAGTEQYIKPFAEWAQEYTGVTAIGPMQSGQFIRDLITQQEQGDV